MRAEQGEGGKAGKTVTESKVERDARENIEV